MSARKPFDGRSRAAVRPPTLLGSLALGTLALAACTNAPTRHPPTPVVPILTESAPAPSSPSVASPPPPRVLEVAPSKDAAVASPAASPPPDRPPLVLRVCADPANLPYSDDRARGFENAIAEILAADLGAALEYAWLPQGEGWLRRTLGAGHCDLVMGVPTAFDALLVTRPYYRSTYVFVQRKGAKSVRSIDDPALRRMKIGVQRMGERAAASPAERALADRGVLKNVVPFAAAGEPPAAERAVQAVASGKLDLAVLWGPQAGFFASTASRPVSVTPVAAPSRDEGTRFDYAIGVGVPKDRPDLRDALDRALAERRTEIDRILAAYGVPRTDSPR